MPPEVIRKLQLALRENPFWLDEEDVEEVIEYYVESRGDGLMRQSYNVRDLAQPDAEEGVPPASPVDVQRESDLQSAARSESGSAGGMKQVNEGPTNVPADLEHEQTPNLEREPEPKLADTEPFVAACRSTHSAPTSRDEAPGTPPTRARRAMSSAPPSRARRAFSGASHTQRELQHAWYWGVDSINQDGRKVREWRPYSQSVNILLEDAVERSEFMFPISLSSDCIVDLAEWATHRRAWQRLTSDPEQKRPLQREPSTVAKMYEEAKGAFDGSIVRASIAFTEGVDAAPAGPINEAHVNLYQTIKSFLSQQEAGKSQLGKNLASWPMRFAEARSRCATATDPIAGSSELLQYIRSFMNDCIKVANPIDRSSVRARRAVRPAADQDIIEAAMQSIVLEGTTYEGMMGRVREGHLNEELLLSTLRRRLAQRPQADFAIPASHVDPDDWAQARELLAEINSCHTALGQLGCVVRAAKAVYETVEKFKTEPGKHLTVGADEFTPIFVYIVLMSETVDIYSCIDFIEKCAPESKAYSGEGGYYLMQLTSAAQLLGQLAVAELPAEGMLPVGYGGEDDPDAGLRRLMSHGDIHWVWSWADDSNRALGREQDKYVQYNERTCEELEQALKDGASFYQIDSERHVDLNTSPMWQVVSATQDTRHVRKRRVLRETAAQSMQRRSRYQAYVAARAKRDTAEQLRYQNERKLNADEGIPENTLLSMWPLPGVEAPVGDALYVSFAKQAVGSNRHTVQFAHSDSTRLQPGHAHRAFSKLYTFQLKDYDVRVMPPDSLGEHRPVGVEDGRASSFHGGSVRGVGFGRGGLYSPNCWRPETNREGEW